MPKPEVFDAIIVGGGAAGLAAAITYRRRPDAGKLLLLEAKEECGKKILATGNGRCNVSNTSAEGYEEVQNFFATLAVFFREEDDGRVYPMSGRAESVRDALIYCVQNPGVGLSRAIHKDSPLALVRAPSGSFEMKSEARAIGIELAKDGFEIELEDGLKIFGKSVLVATGGKAGPAFGSLGDGYIFARALGHTVETIRPSLVPLVYGEGAKVKLGMLKGVRVRAKATLEVGGKEVATEEGEVQFTADALSGIVIFDLSAYMPKSIIEGIPRTKVILDLVPDMEEEALEKAIRGRQGYGLEGVMDKKLADLLALESGGDTAKAAFLAKHYEVPISGTKGWKEAQTTRGGISLSEIDEKTGESHLHKGLFFAGEILDEDFICGGYSLNFAWRSGIRAGRALAGISNRV